MAKKQEPPKPLFPLKHEFYASLDAFAHQAGMLADSVSQALQIEGVITNTAMRRILHERLDAFAATRLDGEEQP